MSSEVKAAMKEARNSLREHRYVDAMKQCQNILKEGKDNYTALVMLAAALKEIEDHKSQTIVALWRAINLQPNNPLAWQGLVSFYEKEPDTYFTRNQLVLAYCKLLQLDSKTPKFDRYVRGATGLSMQLNDTNLIAKVVEVLKNLRNESTDGQTKVIDESLACLFRKDAKIAKEHEAIHEKVLSSVINDASFPDRQDNFRRYLKLLNSSGKLDALLASALLMHDVFPTDPYPLEWICRVYAEQTVETGSCENMEIDEFEKALFALEPTSYLAAFARAVRLWRHKNFVESRDVLNHAVALCPKLLHAWILLGKVNLRLYCWSEAEAAALQALQLLENHRDTGLHRRIDLVLVEAMANGTNAQKWSQAAHGCQELLDAEDSNRVKLLLARAYVNLEEPQALTLLEELEKNPETRIEAMILRALSLKNRHNYEEATDVLGSALETSEAWAILGEINWLTGEYGHSLMAFLKGMHADPNNWRCLLYLGHYYRERGNDLEKSRKCYQKALRINPNSDEAGVGLSTAFRLLKNTEANMQMLLRVTTTDGGGPKWAWLQLGLQQLDQGEVSQAIKSLRYVIRADPNDNHCWESLADAYLARGAHTSALRSYQRALELSPGALYPMIQLANIKVVLGQHVEAKEDFSTVLSQEPRYIPALKGLAETCLGLAKEAVRQQLLGRARRHAQQAADCLTDAIVENSELSCIWKLLGDACHRVAVFPKAYSHLEIARGLVKPESSSSSSSQEESRVTVGKRELLALARRCFCRALSLSKDSALLWHDVACCYLSELRSDPHASDRRKSATKCLAAAKRAVQLNPASWVHWNILAVACMTEEVKNYALAQHCWVMAIDREPNNAIAWTNLGTLYLSLGEPYKANEAFSRAQRADPEYTNSWIGQGMIAETMHRKEAMDLFRHATSLGYHGQAAMGYAHWVLTTLLDPEVKKDPLYSYTIENMHAVAVATDAMTWFIEHAPEDACGRNALGLLLERRGLYEPASRQFTEAALSIEQQQQQQPQQQDNAAKLDAVRMNLSRVLVQLERYDEAIEACASVKTASFKSHCQLAIALFKAERYEESYAAYEATLNWLADAGSDKAHVLCAMAAMAYMFQDVDDVKTLLFQCIQIEPPTVAGLLAAAALGLLHDDTNLATLVLRELEPYKDDPEHRHRVALLSAYSRLVLKDVDGAIRVLSKAVHRHPDDVACWLALVKMLQRSETRGDGEELTSPRRRAVFARCAQKAMLLGRRKTSAIGVSQTACVAALGQLTDSNSLASVEKIVFTFPGNVESWATLVAALSSRRRGKNDAAWLTRLISTVRGQLKTTKTMDDWLLNNERDAALAAA